MLYVEVKDGMSLLIPIFKIQVKKEVETIYEEMIKEIGKDWSKASIAKEIISKTKFIDKLLNVIQKYNKIIAESFDNNTDIKAAYNSALGSALNKEIPGVII